MSTMTPDNNILNKYYSFFIGLYNRNKKLLLIAVIIYFASLFIGIFIGYFASGFTGYYLTYIINGLRGVIMEITTLSIFSHNLQSILFTYIGGIILIIPVAALAFNGFIYGAFVGFFSHGGVISNYLVSNPVVFIIYTLPHGIFEIPSFIIASAGGLRLTTLVIGVMTSMGNETPISEHYWKLKDSLALLAISIILIFIAAIIEANFSVHIGNYITGLHLHSAVNINT
ncbi:MAG: stage II sporulation protein M [Methanobacterium sp.]